MADMTQQFLTHYALNYLWNAAHFTSISLYCLNALTIHCTDLFHVRIFDTAHGKIR